MVIKQSNNKIVLTDNLKNEEYPITNLIDFENLSLTENVSLIENESLTENKLNIKVNKNKKNNKNSTKNTYPSFMKKKTEEFKKNKPDLSGKERRKEILNLWKLEKEKDIDKSIEKS